MEQREFHSEVDAVAAVEPGVRLRRLVIGVLVSLLVVAVILGVVLIAGPGAQDLSRVHSSVPLEDVREIAGIVRRDSVMQSGRAMANFELREAWKLLKWTGEQNLLSVVELRNGIMDVEVGFRHRNHEGKVTGIHLYREYLMVKTNGAWRILNYNIDYGPWMTP